MELFSQAPQVNRWLSAVGLGPGVPGVLGFNPFLVRGPQKWTPNTFGDPIKIQIHQPLPQTTMPLLNGRKLIRRSARFCKDKPEFAYNPLNRGRDFGPLDLTATVIYCRWVDSLVPWFSVSERKLSMGKLRNGC